MKSGKISITQEGEGEDAFTVVKVRQGTWGGVIFFIPVAIAIFLLFGLVPSLFKLDASPDELPMSVVICVVIGMVLFTLFWVVVAVCAIFQRGELKIGTRKITWFCGVGRFGFTTRLQVEGGMWSRLKPMKSMWSVCVTDRSGKEVSVFDGDKTPDCQKLCEEVRRRLHNICGISLDAPQRGAEESFAAAQFAKAHVKVLHGEHGCIKVTYRCGRVIKGMATLVAVVGLFAFFTWVCFWKGDASPWKGLLFVPPLIAASLPSLYDFFGRREMSLCNGEGVYFNGIGKIGLRRCFRYDSETEVFKGETEYWMNGRKLPELQMRKRGEVQLMRIFAHPEEKVVEEFALILRQECAAVQS